ncbi:MAG: M13 family metallopeptidase [Sphingomonadaceae bacterium]|nr:M13 family metallopeptidase [Sphingomonadaceae bacterium]
MIRLTPFAVLLLAGAAVAAAPFKTSGIDFAGIDHSVAPGDQFDQFANGAWRKATEIPADRSAVGTSTILTDRAEKRNAAIIQDAAKSNPAAGIDARRIADYYAAFMDQAGIDARGLTPLKPQLDAIAAVNDRRSLSRALGASLRADVDPINNTNFQTENLFGLFVTQSLADPSKTVPYMLQGGLGMPDRDYYLSDSADMAKLRAAYRVYIADLLRLAGMSDAQARADRIFALETKIAKAHADIVSSQDVHNADNAWNRADFARKAPGIDWDAYFAAAGLSQQSDFIAWHAKPIAGLSALVASEPVEAWKDWMAFNLINQYGYALPTAIADRRFDFVGKTLNGIPAQRPRWKRGIANVNVALGDAVGRIYARRYFPPSSKADIQGMVKNILAAFDRRVAGLTWMAPATKAEARHKIETLRVGVGYPETWRDYAGYEVRPDDAFGNAWRASLSEYHWQLGKIGKPVDRGEWWMTPQTVNAVNLPLQNALNFPAAILDAPYYDPKADAATNYGSIGATIGHEISHSFDNSGAEFDASGRMRNWWTKADFAHFKASGAALAVQYSAYEPFPGLHINGEQTLGENIADVAGLAAAYDAYHASLHGRPAPVIDGLTGDQRFFLAFAQSWRVKMREAAERVRIATDGHAPGEYRALTVRNLDGWYPAWKVTPGQKLYLAPKDRVKVW